MKVHATRRYPGPAWEELRDVEVGPVEGAREDVEVLVVANEPIDPARFPALRLVANFGVGYDRIDVAACAARGIAVTNTPGVLDAAVADLTFALILGARRRVLEGDRRIRSQDWEGAWPDQFLAEDVAGSTLGIVGFGRIGRAVARRAAGFDMHVLSVRSSDSDEAVDLLLQESDVVTLHVPSTPRTRGMIDARRLALLRGGACFVNTARGDLVDESALVAELVTGRIRAGLDVFAHEPNVPAELLSLPNVVLTPHLGSATVQTRSAMTRLVVDNVLALERGQPLISPVLDERR